MPQDHDHDSSALNIADPDTWPLALKLSEVAEVLRVTEPVVRKLIEQGRLRAIAISPGAKRPSLRVPRKDVLALIGEISSRPGQIVSRVDEEGP